MNRYFFILIFWGVVLEAKPLHVPLRAESAILVNAENGVVLFEKKADEIRFPASITKIATAWYILEKFRHRLDEQVVVSKEAVTYCPVHLKRNNSEKFPSHLLEPGATHMSLMAQEVVSARTLLYGLMLVSANDAANALAEHFCGSVEKFMTDLNQFLHENGFKYTSFNNPHGLHHENHRTTAREMAGIASKALQNPLFQEILGTQSYEKPASNKQPSNTLRQFDRLIIPGKYFYPKAIGGKTGHTARAGFTLLAAAKHGGRTLVGVFLGCKEANDRYIDAKALFEAAFNEKKVSRTLLTSEHDRFHFQLKGAKQPLQAKMQTDLKLEYYPSEEPQLKSHIEWSIPPLPIPEGQVVGKLVIYNDKGHLVAHQPLVALSGVEPTLWKQCSGFFKRFTSSKRTLPILMMMMAVSFSTIGVLRVFKKQKAGDKER